MTNKSIARCDRYIEIYQAEMEMYAGTNQASDAHNQVIEQMQEKSDLLEARQLLSKEILSKEKEWLEVCETRDTCVRVEDHEGNRVIMNKELAILRYDCLNTAVTETLNENKYKKLDIQETELMAALVGG